MYFLVLPFSFLFFSPTNPKKIKFYPQLNFFLQNPNSPEFCYALCILSNHLTPTSSPLSSHQVLSGGLVEGVNLILFSSSTIDFIVPIRGFYLLINMVDSDPHLVSLFMLPLFHVMQSYPARALDRKTPSRLGQRCKRRP